MMRLLFLLFCLVAWLPAVATAPAQPSTAETKQTLHTVIRSQLEAFRRGDFAAAYEFAAAGIRAQFPLADFSAMVKARYPTIAANSGVTFGLTFDDGEHAIVNVRVRGQDESSRSYRYELDRVEKGWRIAGVVLQIEEDAGTI